MNTAGWKKHRSWLYSAGIAVLISLWLLSGTLDEPETGPAAAESVATTAKVPQGRVRVRTQTAEDVVRTITINGETAPARIVQISAETDGRVTATVASRGANIGRGGLLVRLDDRDRHARLATAQAMLKQREVEYQGRLKLKSESYVSEAQLQEAVAQLEAAKAEVRRAELDLEYMNVRAPFDGALQSRVVEVGDFVKVGDPIATFVDNRRIIVTADVSEFDARHVEVGESAEARLATGELVRGQIRYVAPVADAATRTFTVELEVDNADGAFRAGGTAELMIPAEVVSAHRVSPSLLTLDDAGNIGLKIINDQGRVEFVVADVALSTSNGVWLAGLPETSTIITVGQGFVNTGSLVDAVPENDIETSLAIKGENGND